MSIISDAERYLQLAQAGLVTDDNPSEIIDGLVRHFRRYGIQNQLVAENQSLKTRIAELECNVSEANGRTRLVEHKAVQLEEMNKKLHVDLARCQTHPLGSIGSMPSPEIITDRRLEDPNFVPCRRERCSRESLHAEGACAIDIGSKRKKRTLDA